MLVLLPPSETKATRARGKPLDLSSLGLPELTEQRRAVMQDLAQVSAREDAFSRLGVSPNLAAEVERNLRLESNPTLPARQLYTGVLYDALDLASMDSASRRRANRRLMIISALYGAVRPHDRLAPYRLSMDVTLPTVGPLARAWRPLLAEAIPAAAGRGLVVDARSSTYVAAWKPRGELARRWVHIAVPGATHMAKHTRGLVARTLCLSPDDPRTPQGLADVLSHEFQVALRQPQKSGPWVLEVNAR